MTKEEYMDETRSITDLILKAKEKAYAETNNEPEPGLTTSVEWPVHCEVGPGLEGAIAGETEIGYVNGTKGWLIYRGYDIFDLAAYSTYEEVSYLLLHGDLPTRSQLSEYKQKLIANRHHFQTKRQLMGFPIEQWTPMSALRLGTLFMRQKQTYRDYESYRSESMSIATDEDSIPMEIPPYAESHAKYEFNKKQFEIPDMDTGNLRGSEGLESCYRLVAALPSITAAIARIRSGHLPLEPRSDLSHAANFLYMMNGKEPTPLQARVMDVSMILHADHGMNASTFAAMVVASTLSDIYFSIGSGIAALNGPLHGGANEEVLKSLLEIGSPENVPPWYEEKRKNKDRIMGFGHRVYKAYDPRARVLEPLASLLASDSNEYTKNLYNTAHALENQVVSTLGEEKKIFPNVDFYSGIVYSALGIKSEMFTPIFAVARVAGWTARVYEYLQHNRIFRPRAVYTGRFDRKYTHLGERGN